MFHTISVLFLSAVDVVEQVRVPPPNLILSDHVYDEPEIVNHPLQVKDSFVVRFNVDVAPHVQLTSHVTIAFHRNVYVFDQRVNAHDIVIPLLTKATLQTPDGIKSVELPA